jgi:hypothetical protein
MSDKPQAARELPRYKCHKEVWALKIKAIEILRPTIADLDAILAGGADADDYPGAMITPEEEGYAPFGVSTDYMHKHTPEVGGYFVVYFGDGHQSYSPAKAFEEGYTRIP